jgi:hypothetical protein
VDKGGMVAKFDLMTLAQLNEKFSVLEKPVAKPVAEVSEDEDDDLSFLPVKSIADFEKFEKHLKQNKDVFRKLVFFIYLQWVPKVSVRLRGSVGKTRFSKRSQK